MRERELASPSGPSLLGIPIAPYRAMGTTLLLAILLPR
jgi:hypothetical protein